MKRALPTLLALVCLPLALFARLPLDDAKDLKSKDPDVRLAALHHIIESGAEDAGKLLTRALKDDDWQVVAEAATALGDFGKPEATSTLAKLAWDGASVPVRMAAARAAAKLDLEKALKELAKNMSGDRARHVLEAYAIVLREAPEDTRLSVPKAILKQLKAKDTLTRAAAARALVLAVAGPDDQGQLAWLLKRLTDEPNPAIREDLAVALGVEGLAGVDEALIAALEDPDWGVALCAAVSLGRTRSEAAAAPLIALTRGSLDWRLRGAAVVGLCHVMRKEVVLPLIERLADPEPLVARTALGFLKSINKRAPTTADPEAWLTWWPRTRSAST